MSFAGFTDGEKGASEERMWTTSRSWMKWGNALFPGTSKEECKPIDTFMLVSETYVRFPTSKMEDDEIM